MRAGKRKANSPRRRVPHLTLHAQPLTASPGLLLTNLSPFPPLRLSHSHLCPPQDDSESRANDAPIHLSASPSPPSSSSAPHPLSTQPSLSFSPPSSPFPPDDYLVEIDAFELANDLSFAEQLANQINARRRHREGEEGQGEAALSTLTEEAGSVGLLMPPSRAPSLQSLVQGGEGDGMEGVLSDADVNAVLEEMMRNEAFGGAVYVEDGVEREEEQTGREVNEPVDDRAPSANGGEEKKEQKEGAEDSLTAPHRSPTQPPTSPPLSSPVPAACLLTVLVGVVRCAGASSNKRLRTTTSSGTPRKQPRHLRPLSSPTPPPQQQQQQTTSPALPAPASVSSSSSLLPSSSPSVSPSSSSSSLPVQRSATPLLPPSPATATVTSYPSPLPQPSTTVITAASSKPDADAAVLQALSDTAMDQLLALIHPTG